MTTLIFAATGNGATTEKIIVPEGVEVISDRAFENYSAATEISLPDTLIRIGQQAFLRCSSLTQVVLPESVTTISMGGFDECSSLREIVIKGYQLDVGMEPFGTSKTLVLYINMDSTFGEYARENGIPAYYAHASAETNTINVLGCATEFTVAEIPHTIGDYVVQYIEGSAFSEMDSLTELSIDAAHIGVSVAASCGALSVINIGENVESIDYGCFNYLGYGNPNGETTITIYAQDISIDGSAFERPYNRLVFYVVNETVRKSVENVMNNQAITNYEIKLIE